MKLYPKEMSIWLPVKDDSFFLKQPKFSSIINKILSPK